jgi:hypothetical protein
MATTVRLSIAGRGEGDAPLLDDLLEQIHDFFEILDGVAESIAGDDAPQFEWRVVGLSKNSPASITVEAVPRPGFPMGAVLAAQARDQAAHGLVELQRHNTRPLHFTNNVLDAADRFARRVTRGLAETALLRDDGEELVIRPQEAAAAIKNIAEVRAVEPVYPYKEVGSFEGYIQNVGADGWGHPFIIVRNRISGTDVKCFLSGDALSALEKEPVANVVWRHRRVFASGLLKFRSLGRLTQADINRLDFADPEQDLPQLGDVIDREFTGGLTSEEYLERLRNGNA